MDGTHLVLLPTVTQPGLPKIIHHSGPSHHVVILVRDVIVFTLEWLACCILSFTGNSSDELGRFEDGANFRLRWARDVRMAGSPIRRREVVQDGREGCRRQAGEGQLVGSVVSNSLEPFIGVLGLSLGGIMFLILVGFGRLSGRPGGLEGLRWQQAARGASSSNG